MIELFGFKMESILAFLLGFVAAAVGFGVTIWYLLGFGVAVPALVLEDLKAGAAMKRSVFLTRRQRAKVFLILLLTTIITYVAALVFQGPFWLASALVAERGESVLLFSYLTGISGAVGAAFVGPLMMLGLALLYFDLRVRREGFDLQMMLSQLQEAPVSAEAPGPPSLRSQD